MKNTFIILLVILLCKLSLAQCNCTVCYDAFCAKEDLLYNISYNWGIIDMNAGEVNFTTELDYKNGKAAHHFKGAGRTYDNYDWIYKVRDIYESWADTSNLRPVYYYRKVDEGGTKSANYYNFTDGADTVYAKTVTSKETIVDTLIPKGCIYDVLTLVYYCRTIDFSSLEINQKVPLSIILDNKISEIYIRYLGKEIVDLGEHGKYNTLKFSSLLVEGSIFSGGEQMVVWVTNDNNRMPVKVQAEILVGSINATITKKSGLKHPLTSLIKE